MSYQSSTTVNINGETVYSSTYRMGDCLCCNRNSYINSCFMYPKPACMIGMALGMATVAYMPQIFNWFTTTALPFAWNSVIKPIGIGIGQVAAWVGKGIGQGASWVAQKTGLKKLFGCSEKNSA